MTRQGRATKINSFFKNPIMPQNAILENHPKAEFSSQTSVRGDLRPINPSDIKVPDGVNPDASEVERIVQILKNKGSLPSIVIAPDNTLISGINALEAAKQFGQNIILASVQKPRIEVEKIALTQIKLDGGTQSRAGINQETLAEYAHAWQEGAKFPAVILFYDGESYWLADGFHRVLSARQAELTEIDADIRQGTRRDAVLFSVGANANHGLRRTNEDKRRAVTTLLQDEEWKQWSDREIARRTGVHHDTVGRLRAELSGGIRQIDEERKVNRGSSTYTQKAKAPTKREQRWIPNVGDRVRITAGQYKDKLATVTVVLTFHTLCHIDGNPENKRDQVSFGEMEPAREAEGITSVRQETKEQQKELGLGNRTQVLPDAPRNTGITPTEAPMQSSAVNLAAVGDSLVAEIAIALVRLTPKQMGEVFAKIEEDLSVQQIEAIWQSLHNHFAHKAA